MSPTVIEVPTALGPAHATLYEAQRPHGLVALTHGANGSMAAADLHALAAALPPYGWSVALVRQAWAVAGKRMPPPPATQDAAWLPIAHHLRGLLPGGPFVQGGRSNGARVACRTAADAQAAAVLCLAFPLHPPGKPAVSRAAELLAPGAHGIPVRVVQGRTDPFGTPDEVRAVLPDPAALVEVPGGHSFTKPPTAVVDGVGVFLAALALTL